jgi:hypothetical protein
MIHTLLRYTASIGLGLAIALSFLGVSQLANTPIAHAQQLEESDFLPSEFGDATGLGTDSGLEETIGNIINIVIGFLGIVAVVIVLLGGFKWMTAGGNDEKVAEAKKLLIAGVIGLAIVLSAYAITSFVIGSLLTAAG